MIQKINGEQPFQILSDAFTIGPSQTGYDLQISANGTDYSTLFSVAANTTRLVNNVSNGAFFRLKNNVGEVDVNWRTTCKSSGSGGSGSGGTDTGTVQTMINQSLSNYTANLEEGEPIVGMAKQLYSPDGVTTEGAFTYRTTGGDKDVSSGPAELRKIEGNSIYPEPQYNDSASLEREGSEVTGFTYDIEWGDTTAEIPIEVNTEGNYGQKVKMRLLGSGVGYGFYEFYYNGSYTSIRNSYGERIVSDNATKIDNDHFTFNNAGAQGTIEVEDEFFVFTITGGTGEVTKVNYALTGVPADPAYMITGTNIPNDIPIGESTYTYADATSAWTPSLPQALQNMQIDGSDYVPQDGDEITINRNVSRQGRAQFANPRTFVSVGLNSFNKDAATPISTIIGEGWYAVKGVTGLEKGYTIYDENSGITAVGLNSTPDSTGAELLDNVDAALNYITPTAEKPWIVFQTANADKVCVHPRWSGYNDLVYEPYTESKIEGLFSIVVNCPMWSVGNVRNIIDIENGQIIRNIGSEEYSAARVNELLASGYTLGVDFDFDSALIYKVLDTPVIIAITFDGSYDANDFGVEYFVDENGIIPTPVYAETYYMQNLVDKLRRMEGLVHLDSLSGTGSENTLYEYNNELFIWCENPEWGRWIGNYNNRPAGDENYGGTFLCYDYMGVPNEGMICHLSYNANDAGKNLFLYDGKLVTYTANTPDFTTAPADTIQPNTDVQIGSVGIGNMRIYWDTTNKFIRITGSYNGVFSAITTTLSDYGWCAAEKNYNYAFRTNDAIINGIPRWTNEGKIVGRETSYNKKTFYLNSTGYSNSIGIVTDGSNGGNFNRMFFPSQGGTSGQLLLSSGGGEPTWSNWIKSVQITSDAYEALVQAGTTDPNTLYLITD